MIHNLYIHEADLVGKLRLGFSENLAALFDLRTKRWPHPYMHDECFTLSTFGDLTQNIPNDRAFSLIPLAFDIALKQTDQTLLLTSLSLIIDLLRASDTTELTPTLIEKINGLDKQVLSLSNNGKVQTYWNSIKEWYRLT